MHLDTPRLFLRTFEPRDATTFSTYRSDPEVARYQGWEAPYSLAQAERFVAEMTTVPAAEPGRWVQLAMQPRAGGEIIGDVAYQVLADDPRQAEIGFTLARAHQGQGYATEAVTRLLAYLFDDLHLHRVRANCDPLNTTSAHLLARVGMRHEGRMLESLWFKGGWAGEDWFAILEWEYRKQHPI